MSLNPLYIQEVSPTNLRGAFATLNQVSFASGILVGMVRADVPGTLPVAGPPLQFPLPVFCAGGRSGDGPGNGAPLGRDVVIVPRPSADPVPAAALLPREPSIPPDQPRRGGRGQGWWVPTRPTGEANQRGSNLH